MYFGGVDVPWIKSRDPPKWFQCLKRRYKAGSERKKQAPKAGGCARDLLIHWLSSTDFYWLCTDSVLTFYWLLLTSTDSLLTFYWLLLMSTDFLLTSTDVFWLSTDFSLTSTDFYWLSIELYTKLCQWFLFGTKSSFSFNIDHKWMVIRFLLFENYLK